MKRSQIILFSLSILISGGIYLKLKSNEKEQPKNLKEENKTVYVRVKEVNNAPQLITLVSYGQIEPNTELMVSFQVQGKLIKGALNMKAGTNFRKGQVLYSLDQNEAIFNLHARKATFTSMILSTLPDIELDFPSEKNKWIRFINKLTPKARLPEIPEMGTREEMYFIGKNFFAEYHNLQNLQFQLDKYIYMAPFDGTVTETYSEPGSIVNPGVQVAKIVKTGDYEVKVPISMEDLELYKGKSTAEFIDPSGKKIATGEILRVSNVINQQTQSADVYYSIKAIEGEKIYNGMYVNVSINKEATKETVVLPRTAILGGEVNVLEKNKILPYKVTIVGTIPDSIFVTGLKNGQKVILEQPGAIDPKVKYKAIAQ